MFPTFSKGRSSTATGLLNSRRGTDEGYFCLLDGLLPALLSPRLRHSRFPDNDFLSSSSRENTRQRLPAHGNTGDLSASSVPQR
jgi:hypothetical protein